MGHIFLPHPSKLIRNSNDILVEYPCHLSPFDISPGIGNMFFLLIIVHFQFINITQKCSCPFVCLAESESHTIFDSIWPLCWLPWETESHQAYPVFCNLWKMGRISCRSYITGHFIWEIVITLSSPESFSDCLIAHQGSLFALYPSQLLPLPYLILFTYLSLSR